MKKSALLLVFALGCTPAGAATLLFTPEAAVGQTGVSSAALGGIGLSEIGSITIRDNNAGTAGSAGVFSGFDLDFVFIDLDGSAVTTGDRVFASTLAFTTGTVRPTGDVNFQPTAAHPGPTFGSLAADTIDSATATLDVLDASFGSPLAADTSSGWLTLGDGGTLVAGFGGLVLTGTERLFIGEAGGNGEIADASVTAVPLPGTLALLGLGVLGLGMSRRRTARE